jgi:hypothetical protein
MASTARTLTREEPVRELMRTTNLMRPEAEDAVASYFGEDISDIVGLDGRPLTAEQKRRLGLGRSILEFMDAGDGESDGARSGDART